MYKYSTLFLKKKLNRVQLAPMVTSSCQLMQADKCDQTLAFVSAAEVESNKHGDGGVLQATTRGNK